MKNITNMYKKGGWIQKAIQKPGSFTEWCKRKGYSGVTEECISEGKESENSTTRKRANLASTLRKISKDASGGILMHKDGGVMRNAYIPYGRMHRYEHRIPSAKLGMEITKKGIPVVSKECDDEGCRIVQSAEIEAAEIIFTEKASKRIEELVEKISSEKDSEKKKALHLKLGRLVKEELANAEDATGKFEDMIKKII